MASAPLFAALAMRTLYHQEAARPRRRRFRRLVARQDLEAPMRAAEEGLDRPLGRAQGSRDLMA